jgi:release factor glutamine methyltransferase
MNADVTSANAERQSGVTMRGALRWGAARLAEAGIENAALDAEVLLRCVLGVDRAQLYLRLEDQPSGRVPEKFRALLERRATREPLAYITGNREFWSLDFTVTPAVLVPRPETELLIELALYSSRRFRRDQPIDILDIGTGSGAIAVALATHLPHSQVWATDVSRVALEVAEANAKRHNVADRLHLLCGDLFGALAKRDEMFDLIVSNPPYIATAGLRELEPEVRIWEPAAALDGGPDGLHFYRRIIAEAAAHLKEDGRVVLEIGADQGARVAQLFDQRPCYTAVEIHRDGAGRDRVVAASKGMACG